MVSSGMSRHVALVITDVSEELIASFIRVTRIGELGKMLPVTSNRCTVTASSPILVTLMKEALRSSETSVLRRATQHNIPEDAFFIVTTVKTSNLAHFHYFMHINWLTNKLENFS
jgi:hypothetical protein